MRGVERMKFNFEKYKDKKVVMHCRTLAEAEDFCREMHEAGLRWWHGENYLKYNGWHLYENDTCYNFNENSLGYCERAEKNGYEILKWGDFMNAETQWEHHKDELMRYIEISDSFAVKEDGTISDCKKTDCDNCIFFSIGKHCPEGRKEWLSSPYKQPFDEKAWIDEWEGKWLLDKSVRTLSFDKFKITMIVDKYGKVGIAKKYPSDEFDRRKGVAIAYARYCGEPIPEEL